MNNYNDNINDVRQVSDNIIIIKQFIILLYLMDVIKEPDFITYAERLDTRHTEETLLAMLGECADEF